MYNIVDLLKKKRLGEELSWEEIEFFIKNIKSGGIREAQIGAMLMAFQMSGLTDVEVELLMKAMLFSGERLSWPADWDKSLVSIQSTGTTGNKAKVILAPTLAACGIKCPILSARGVVNVGGILGKLVTVPGFTGAYTFDEIKKLLSDIGCCVVQQPQDVAPAEREVRDTASIIGAFHNNSIKAACLIARVTAMHLHADVIEIVCGPSESLKTREEGNDLVAKIRDLSRMMGVRCQVLLTHVNGPVGKMIGQSLEIQEAIWCLNGEGPPDLFELVCTIGGHALHVAGKADSYEKGQKMAAHAIKTGSAKKKFMDMLHAQGVSKQNVKDLFKHRKIESGLSPVLPVAHYFTHLSAEHTGFVHNLNLTTLNEIMHELVRRGTTNSACVGGIQLLVQVGSYLNRGEVWAKIHHHVKLDEDQTNKLNTAITLRLDPPLYDMTIDVKEQ
ncbi:hypothetical protein NP493_93g01044 [Ridgeia piscesae]|uniref:Thymidine phosphorylase n=1 Tax=Ridgeia piscesae TaxID=27915 RepID=A0AAD9UHV4_RIDPI|nr:hypothetical protein NP493_93g01044 [Ridgeia piscesae]